MKFIHFPTKINQFFLSLHFKTEPQTGAQNLKVKFLTQKQSDLRKEIEHLNCENQRLTELCQTKDGEVHRMKFQYNN